MPARLIVRAQVDGIGPYEETFEFRQEVIALGRREECDVTLQDNSVSRQHAQIQFHDGQWSVMDVGSSKGTAVNGDLLEAEKPVYLSTGDILTIAPFDIEFEAIEEDEAILTTQRFDPSQNLD